MTAFFKSSPGRLLALASSIVLIGGGVAALLGEPNATILLAGAFPVAIALGVVAVFTASSEHFAAAIAAVIAMPMLMLAYACALGVVVTYFPAAGYAFIAIGAGALALAMRASLRSPPEHHGLEQRSAGA